MQPRYGEKCTNPPAGAEFYPLYTTTKRNGQCWWQFGGAAIPGTDRAFGKLSYQFADLEPRFIKAELRATQVRRFLSRTFIGC